MNDLLSNYLDVIISSAAFSTIAFFIIKKIIASRFERSLENHKGYINKELEGIRHDQNKLYKEFELFTVKKHEHYPELYKKLELCIGEVMRLRGNIRTLNYSNAGKQDIQHFMEERLFTIKDREEILGLWETDKPGGIRKLKERLERIKYNEAEEEFINANNYFILNQFYFSEDLAEITRELLGKVHNLWLNYDPDYRYYNDPDFMKVLRNENPELIKVIGELKEQIQSKIRNELTR
ncbi:hypothetical protein NYE67_18540 [Solibacillus sp. FSL W8-0474]|uniref:hypothetical protein n=1 Tax=Solibacillus sp. FSL W8-0474 TaxID=2975336 RepID=UPI0030F92DA1